ncbi:hypothetical protein Ahy_B08g092729 [Arachis hypogaea]|uniref:F-box domain-containing protein n=1 Tax=Arachis hypogaea TaxID=3818 RepID=A0A444Y4J1_ARAHY|nr:hypothetical protein Ahy_B08g092729 [Arachis hypogaea]
MSLNQFPVDSYDFGPCTGLGNAAYDLPTIPHESPLTTLHAFCHYRLRDECGQSLAFLNMPKHCLVIEYYNVFKEFKGSLYWPQETLNPLTIAERKAYEHTSYPILISFQYEKSNFCNLHVSNGMSDIFPLSIPLSDLPNEVMLDIFHLTDASTILNTRITSRYWRMKLNSYEFITRIAKRWKYHGCLLTLHFCYPFSLLNSLDWVMRMDASSGYTISFHLPFLLAYEDIENGIFCIRYSSMGRKSYLLAWNPVSRRSKIIQDPIYVFKPKMLYKYALLYFSSALDYAILHVFKHSLESPACKLTIYTSFRRNWDVVLTCLSYVQTLDATYVTLDGSIYWLTCSPENVEKRSSYIVFSILFNNFQHVFFSEKALGHCYMLMILNQKLCLASSDHDEEVFHTSIWYVDVTQKDLTWTMLFMYNGIGSLFTHTIFVDEDITQIKTF